MRNILSSTRGRRARLLLAEQAIADIIEAAEVPTKPNGTTRKIHRIAQEAQARSQQIAG